MNPDLGRQARRFLLAGGINTLLTLAIYQCLLFWLPYTLAFTLAFVAGIVFTGLVYTRFVFTVRPTGRRFVSNALYYVLSYGVNLFILSILIDGLALHERIAIILTIGLMVPLNFICLRWLLSL